MTPRAELELVLDADHAEAILQHRQAKRAKLTPYAAKLLAKQFAQCPDPNEAADEVIRRGWTGFRVEWLSPKTSVSTIPKPTSTPSSIASKLLQVMKEADNHQQGRLL